MKNKVIIKPKINVLMRKKRLLLGSGITESRAKAKEDNMEVSKMENQLIAMQIDLIKNSKRDKMLLEQPYYILELKIDA